VVIHRSTGNGRRLSDEAIVLRVVADPEPQNPALHVYAECPMLKADSARPKPAHALELKRGVARVGFEKLIFLVSQALDHRSQAPVAGPKFQ
jgi:hypothetical protein